MNQALHIFRKDVRHLYPEILLTLAVLLAFAWAAPVQWIANYGGQNIFFLAAPLLRVLMPITWLVLVARVVHDESLVGDRQFWITRPYRWPSLLAAKLLFLLLFLSVPFLLMQLYLLHHAGLNIVAAVPDLLLYQLRLTAIFFLPILAVAVVTSSFARLTLTVLLGLLYLGLVFAFGAWFTDKYLFPPSFAAVALALASLVLTALIFTQYAARRTRAVRLSLLTLPVFLAALSLAAPAKSLVERTYPALPTSLNPHWMIDSSRPSQQSGTGGFAEIGRQVTLKLPILQGNTPAGERFNVHAIAASIDSPEFHWSSPYLESGGVDLSNTPSMTLVVPRGVFEQIRTTPVNLRLQLTATVYGTGAAVHARAAAPSFPAPGRGVCPLDVDGNVGKCLYAFRLPTPIDAAVQVSVQPCGGGQGPIQDQPAAPVATTFIGSDDDGLAFDFDPVATTPMRLFLPGSTPEHPLSAFLCSGSPLTFTTHPIVRSGTFMMSAQQIILDAYAQQHR